MIDMDGKPLKHPAAYIAGRYALREKLLGAARHLQFSGISVTSRWLHGLTDQTVPETKMLDAELGEFARQDLLDIRRADYLILFGESPEIGYTTGGRMVEMGYALALGIPVVLIGPHENVFSRLPVTGLSTGGVHRVSSILEAVEFIMEHSHANSR